MASIEAKSQTLWELYRNNSHANTVMEDVELMRRRADTIGVVTTLAIFGLNTATRFTMRSRKYTEYSNYSPKDALYHIKGFK